jgi:hypothetical protein
MSEMLITRPQACVSLSIPKFLREYIRSAKGARTVLAAKFAESHSGGICTGSTSNCICNLSDPSFRSGRVWLTARLKGIGVSAKTSTAFAWPGAAL